MQLALQGLFYRILLVDGADPIVRTQRGISMAMPYRLAFGRAIIRRRHRWHMLDSMACILIWTSFAYRLSRQTLRALKTWEHAHSRRSLPE